MLTRREFAKAFAAAAVVRRRGSERLASPTQPAPATEPDLARILRTKKLRVAALVGEEPYFYKRVPSGQWSGFCSAMARDLASELGVEPAAVEANWAELPADLNGARLDLAYGPRPTAQRAMFAEFANPLFYDTYAIVARKGFAPKGWNEINTPETLIAVETGSPREEAARRFAGNTAVTGFKTREGALQAVQSGRADCLISTMLHAIVVLKKHPQLGDLVVPMPALRVAVCPALPYDGDRRFRGVVDAWSEDKRQGGQVREWIMTGLAEFGIGSGDLPADVAF